MKGNTWLAGYILFTAILLGGSGFFLFKSRSAYNETFEGWDSLKGKIIRFEKEVPYPSEDNEKKLEGIVTEYDGKVKALYESLSRYQKPLNAQLTDNEFANQILKNKVADFLKLAGEKGMEVEKKEEFYLGFDAYKTTFPRPEIVPALGYQLDAIEHLLKQLAESGADKLSLLSREQLPGEVAPADPATAGDTPPGIVPGQVVQKYPITLTFAADHRDFQEFLNRLANDKEYFFILRVLRVDNSSPDGPSLGGDESGAGGPSFAKADGTVATKEIMEAKGLATLPFDQFVTAMTADGWEIQRKDARIIFGQEKLTVFAVIDLVRFLSPDEVKSAPEPKSESKGGSRRSKK
ncbi:MAG: Amuc_1100 family pilus-like protein [Verrucomicrobiales bacterium]|nr:Amuc_1100 family pilus-like protein [Verrucomicrobiales bacterium]